MNPIAMNEEQTKYQSVLVIDDQKMVVIAVRMLIGEKFRHFYSAHTGAAGVALAITWQPSLVIVDNVLPDTTGDLVTREIKYHCPDSRILGYSFNVNKGALKKMLDSGVHGYVDKSEDNAQFQKAVASLMEGKEYFSRIAQGQPRESPFQFAGSVKPSPGVEFSPAEIGIIRMTCQQKSLDEMSRYLDLPEKKVVEYQHRINQRIGTEQLRGIIKYAIKHNIIEVDDL